MKMNTLYAILLAAVLLSASCSCQSKRDPDPAGPLQFAKGADISWVTEMESKDYKFFDSDMKEKECTALLHDIGFNAVRYRVWVNPQDGWCDREDVLVKARRAKALGMKIMIDFHYSDWWADPGKQNVPSAWEGQNVEQMAYLVGRHTEGTLRFLKENGIEVSWVQVGNEVENGMLWESGRVQGNDAANFARYFNSGAAAVKKVYPDAVVILHTSNAWDTDTLRWFFNLMKENGVNYDMIGLSLYPSSWGGSADWRERTGLALGNFPMLHSSYGKDVMLVEFGMPAYQPEAAKACLQYLIDNTASYDWFKGIFLWEPESEQSRNGYDLGAFSNGRPTVALDPFRK